MQFHRFLFFVTFCLCPALHAASANTTTEVILPFMERKALHIDYVDALLRLSLEKTKSEFGDYTIRYHVIETLPDRQLKGLKSGDLVSVTFANAKTTWDEAAIRVPFPLLKGLPSYRFFFTTSEHINTLNNIREKQAFYRLSFGQGRGWSTSTLLEKNGFQVIYGSRYFGMFEMLDAGRFTLLMRSSYEILAERAYTRQHHPRITYSSTTAFLTYLPMYFYVTASQPNLAVRLEKGLNMAFESGEIDTLFNHYFEEAVTLSQSPSLRTFWLDSPHVTRRQFEQDKPYLMPALATILQQKFTQNADN